MSHVHPLTSPTRGGLRAAGCGSHTHTPAGVVTLALGSLQRRFDPPQRVLDPPALPLTRLLEVGVIFGEDVDIRGGEAGDAAPQVGLQFSVGAIGANGLLEGVDLTHDHRYAPATGTGGSEDRRHRRRRKRGENRIYVWERRACLFPITFVCGLMRRERGEPRVHAEQLRLSLPLLDLLTPASGRSYAPISVWHKIIFSNQSHRRRLARPWLPDNNPDSTAVPLSPQQSSSCSAMLERRRRTRDGMSSSRK